MLLLVEVLFAAVLVAGVAFVYWPAAMILAGLLGIWACEKRSVARPRLRTVPNRERAA